MPKQTAVPVEECPCEGLKGPWWHSAHKVPKCTFSEQLRREEQAKRMANKDRTGVRRHIRIWIPGSPIYMDEEEVMA